MSLRNTYQSFGTISKIFHWTTVILVFSLLTIGLLMTRMELTPNKIQLYGWHKSLGILVLLLASCWSLWRIFSVKPELPDTLSPLQKRGVYASKYLLLAFLFTMPLTGWGISSAAGFPVSVFGVVTLPNFLAADKQLSTDLAAVHSTLAFMLMAVIFVHASAALLHHFYFKDTVLRRMLPFGDVKNGE